MTGTNTRTGRPLGVSLAIIASVLLFSVIPLLRVGQILLIEQHFRRVTETSIPFDPQNPTEAFAAGGEFTGAFTDDRLILQIIVGVVFLGIAIIAWRGRWTFARYLLIGAVLLLSGLTLALTLLPQLQAAAPTVGEGVSGGSLQGAGRTLTAGQVLLSLFVPLYVVWYLNRAPARAFYRN